MPHVAQALNVRVCWRFANCKCVYACMGHSHEVPQFSADFEVHLHTSMCLCCVLSSSPRLWHIEANQHFEMYASGTYLCMHGYDSGQRI